MSTSSEGRYQLPSFEGCAAFGFENYRIEVTGSGTAVIDPSVEPSDGDLAGFRLTGDGDGAPIILMRMSQAHRRNVEVGTLECLGRVTALLDL